MYFFQVAVVSLLTITGHFISPSTCYAQSENNGIYFIMEEGPCRDNKVKLKNQSGTVCLPDKPMILMEDILRANEPSEDYQERSRSLVIQLTEQGSRKLAAITEIYPGEQLALVLNDRVVSIMEIKKTILSGEIVLREGLSGTTLQYSYKILSQR